MLGSCPISSSIDIAFDALTPIVFDTACRASIASFAARRMLRGVVLSLETSFRTPRACLIRDSYSSFRFAFCKANHHYKLWAHSSLGRGRTTFPLKDFYQKGFYQGSLHQKPP